jgi:CheY-like chemotaxis protein
MSAPGKPLRGLALLVEDNLVNQRVAQKMLERLGLTVDLAGNGQQALEAVARRAYDVILMDCEMPDMDGFEATTRIRDREPEGARRVPIIAVTASATESARQRCYAVGMDAFLAKPLRLQELLDTLRVCMAAPGD